jgi:hypothetical protein
LLFCSFFSCGSHEYRLDYIIFHAPTQPRQLRSVPEGQLGEGGQVEPVLGGSQLKKEPGRSRMFFNCLTSAGKFSCTVRQTTDEFTPKYS